MSFSVGDRVGRFEILGVLGSGGQGDVYRARDGHLHRDVALKVLPDAVSRDPARRRRFEHEARTAGGLSHPNILAVYDVGSEDGSSYIVTEILEGETLQQRISGHGLPVRKAVDYALQIATGLAAAHERGVVHRDVKPANLFVTKDGRIKILDFGLATSSAPDSQETDTVTLVQSGDKIIGTPAYMSPEQARGRHTDHRTDVFSFGLVFYEMLCGSRPFQRDSSVDSLHAIVYDDPPPLPRIDPGIAALERIIRRCLEKNPDERFQNFRDLAFHLQSGSEEPLPGGPHRDSRRLRRAVPITASAVALLVAALAGGIISQRMRSNDTTMAPHRVRVMTNFVGLEEFPSLSPDGRMVVFTATQGRGRQVFVRFVNGGEPLPVTTDDADHQAPRWSPDGSSLVYFSPAGPGELQGTINRIPTLGGPIQRIIASVGGGDVSRSGRLACFRLENQRIQLVTTALDGSDVQVVATLETRHYRYPRWSHDNRWIAFQGGDGFRWEVYVVPATPNSTIVQLTNDNRFIDGLTWLPDSTGIVFASSRGSTIPYQSPLALWEVLLDRERVPRQLTPAEASYQTPDLHASGVLSAARLQTRYDIWAYPFDKAGSDPSRAERMTSQTGQVLTPTASPDGEQIAYLSDVGGHANIWVRSKKGPPRQITFEEDPDVAVGVPIWSPDGRWIAFVSSRGNGGFAFGAWVVRPDGSELRQLITRGLGVAWSPDSNDIYYVESAVSDAVKKLPVSGGTPVTVRSGPVRNLIGVHGTTLYLVVEHALTDGRPEIELHAAPLGDGPARVIASINASRIAWSQGPFNPSLSPDGAWLAMPLTNGFTTDIWALSTRDGRWHQVTNFDTRATFVPRRVSWSSDGRSIIAAVGEADADVVLLDGLVQAVAR